MRAIEFDVILKRLTDEQKDDIRTVFQQRRRASDESEALIADWVRIAEIAHQHSLRSYFIPNTQALLTSPAVRQRRERQLREGKNAAENAVNAINALLGAMEEYVSESEYREFESWAGSVKAKLLDRGLALEQFRPFLKGQPTVRYPKGTPRWLAEGCLLDVLAAYFKQKGWPVANSQVGLFAAVAYIVLPKRRDSLGRAHHRTSMSAPRLRRLTASTLDFATLEKEAPKDVKPALPARTRVPRR